MRKFGEKSCGRFRLSRQAGLVLRIGLPVLAAELLYILFSLEYADGAALARQLLLLPDMLEHVALSGVLLTGGALLFDYAVKRETKK